MDVAEYQVIRGLSALREYLADAPPCWIKVSYFRGLTETYHHEEAFITEEKLNDWASRAGPYREEIDFIVEQPIEGEAVEVGIDTHAVDMGLPAIMLWGYEAKDAAFLGCVGTPPARLLNTSRRFMPEIGGYRGPLSNEIRTTEDKDYLVDLTARYPSPPSEIQAIGMRNFPEVAYFGARGILIDPDYAYRCWAQLVLCSDALEERAIGVRAGMPEWTALHGHCRIGGNDYVVSPSKIPEFGGAVGGGDTFEEAIKLAIEVAEAVKGSQVRFNALAFDEIMETIERGETLGLTWGTR